jgi:simple sugar transport system ATP-binding protein
MHVSLRGIHKRFGSTPALAGAELEVRAGEVHALLGENGAGKTTLVRVLYGLVRPDAGEIRVGGAPVAIRGPRHALELGIGLVHQHFMGVPALTVAENLVLGERGGWRLPRAELEARAGELLERFAPGLDPRRAAGELAVAEQQRLEIARALARGVRLLVLDEPTAVLAPSEVERLLAFVTRLREEGRSVVFISHRLEEVSAVCDRVTVLRAGATVATLDARSLDTAELGRLMVGDALPPRGAPVVRPPGDLALRARGLAAGRLRGIDFELRAGEILAIGGIDGNGQDELEQLLAGQRAPEAGALELMRAPLGLLPGDRQRTGLALDLSIEENLAMADAARGGLWPGFRFGFARPAALRAEAESTIGRYQIRGRPEQTARTLSGGNQQKLAAARALRRDPAVLVAVNPSRGLDAHATARIRDQLRVEARRGTAVLLVSTDLDELLELGTRIAILFRGRLAPVEPERRGRVRIGELMLGAGHA